MADASQQPSDRRLAVEAQRGEGASRFPFLLTDDLRSPLDDLQRLRDAEVKTREIIQKYQAAMREMMVRFEILDQDLNLKKHRNPIHHLESRIKKPASIFEKLERYGKEPTLENLERYIMDVAGVRVICSYIHDVYNLLELLQKQDDLEIVEIKDYINNPKLNGYRSLHVIVRIPVYFLDKKELIPVEVQLRTIAMDFWASLEHDLKYKSVSEVQGIDSYDELKDCSRIIEDVESRMQILARALEMEDWRPEPAAWADGPHPRAFCAAPSASSERGKPTFRPASFLL